MKLSKLKYLFVFVCLFSIMEKTGISVVSLFSHIRISLAEQAAEKQANDSSENNEAKQVEVKEYWAVHADANFSLPHISFGTVCFSRETSRQHYNWCPPVPTPPPNAIV